MQAGQFNFGCSKLGRKTIRESNNHLKLDKGIDKGETAQDCQNQIIVNLI